MSNRQTGLRITGDLRLSVFYFDLTDQVFLVHQVSVTVRTRL